RRSDAGGEGTPEVVAWMGTVPVSQSSPATSAALLAGDLAGDRDRVRVAGVPRSRTGRWQSTAGEKLQPHVAWNRGNGWLTFRRCSIGSPRSSGTGGRRRRQTPTMTSPAWSGHLAGPLTGRQPPSPSAAAGSAGFTSVTGDWTSAV